MMKKLNEPDSEEKLYKISQTLKENYAPEELAKKYLQIMNSITAH